MWYMVQHAAEALLLAANIRHLGPNFDKLIVMLNRCDIENLSYDSQNEEEEYNQIKKPSKTNNSFSYGIFKLWELLIPDLHYYLVTVWLFLGGSLSSRESPISYDIVKGLKGDRSLHLHLMKNYGHNIMWMKEAFRKWLQLYYGASMLVESEKNLWHKLIQVLSSTFQRCLLPEENRIFNYVAANGPFWEFVIDILHAWNQNNLKSFLRSTLELDAFDDYSGKSTSPQSNLSD